MNVGKTIAGLRAAAGLSQQTLAERLSVSRELVSKWENGMRTPDYPTVERIAAVFGIPADRILDKNDLVFRELSECADESARIPEGKLVAALNAFLRSLNRQTAGVFLMRYYDLKTTAEIAAAHRMGENHVRSVLSKTRKKLKRYIEENVR